MSKNAKEIEPLLSVTAMGRLFRLDRGTVSRRLEAVTPARVDNRGKFYRLEDAAPAMARLLEPGKSARQEKTEAEAALLKLKLRREQGDTMAKRDVFAYSLRLFRGMHQRLAVRLPREISAQLYKAESPAHVAEVLQVEMGKVFNEVKEDHLRFMAEEKGEEAEHEEER